MGKIIAPAVAAATALSLTVPATATAATLTPFTKDGTNYCRVTLNDVERGPANQAERAAKTLTHGMYATSVVEAFEATFPELKKLGDDYVAEPTVIEYLRLLRDDKTPEGDVRADARAAVKEKLAPLGLHTTDADFYLDMKEGSQIPLGPAGRALKGNADWFVGIDGGVPKAQPLGDDYVFGRTGKNTAQWLRHVEGWQRDAFAANMKKTYFGQVQDTLESSYYYALEEAKTCHDGTSHVIFPTQDLKLPEAPKLENADLGDTAPEPGPAPKDPEETPDEKAPETFDAKLAQIIGIVAAVLTALGALFALPQNAGVKGLPTIPQIPGLTK